MTQSISTAASVLHTPCTGHCPNCGPVALSPLFEKKGRQFWRCDGCDVRLQWPLPTARELEAYYEREFAEGMYATFTAAEEMKVMTAEQRLKELSPWVPMSGRWLDVGCANGVLVEAAAKRGIAASGVELSTHAVAQGVARGLDLAAGMLEDLPVEMKYDCITAYDVLEHVLDPRGFLQAVTERLKPGGYAVLSLPNVASIFAKVMGSRWWFYIPEEHLHYFTPATVSQLGQKVGLETVRVGRTFKPLTFNYGMTQFVEYNPLIYKVMKLASSLIPGKLREWIVPLYIGEMQVVFRKP